MTACFGGILPFPTFSTAKPDSTDPYEASAAARIWHRRPELGAHRRSSPLHSEVGARGRPSLIVVPPCGLGVDSDRLRRTGRGVGGGYSK
jgi:hypothetical protein